MSTESIHETEFAKLHDWADKFVADDGLAFLIVYGPPGISKSQIFKQRLGSKNVIEGKLTGIAMYQKLWELKDAPIVFDDVDALLKDKDTLNLLKLVGNTDAQKTVQWNSRSKILSSEGIQSRFVTTNRIAIICNSIEKLAGSLPAVLDRAIVVHFNPSIMEIHNEAGHWFGDAEVYDFIDQRISELSYLSLRTYLKAAEMKRVGVGDWKDYTLKACGMNPKLDLAFQILKNPSLQTLEERVSAFKKKGGGSKATFCRYQQELRERHPSLKHAVESEIPLFQGLLLQEP